MPLEPRKRHPENQSAALNHYEKTIAPGPRVAAISSISAAAADVVREQVEGCFVVVVFRPEGKYRRRVYLTLAAAQKASDSARARGQIARLSLARLELVSEVDA